MSYTHLPAGDPSIESFHGRFLKVRRALGTTAFGLNEIRLPPGAEGVEHDEIDTGHEEVYAVLDGSGRFTIDGAVVEVAAGDYLRVDPGSTRVVVAGDDGLRFLAVAGKPKPEYDGRASL
jgi:quercetin dioxygenase-like cupin family protein